MILMNEIDIINFNIDIDNVDDKELIIKNVVEINDNIAS